MSPRHGYYRALRARPTRRRRSRGQAVTEFALILPIFLMITVGVADMARLFTAYVALENGVREAAIFASASSDTGQNYDKWCTDPANKAAVPAVSVPCPAGTTATHQSPDPDNLAYRIDAEASGMNPAGIVLNVPVLTADANCNSILGNGQRVTIVANYNFLLITPIVSSMFPSGVPMTAGTSLCVM